jgi:uncharacterized membrane protein
MAIFYSISLLFGGMLAPYCFSVLLISHSSEHLVLGYYIASTFMIMAAIVAQAFSEDVEGLPLEKAA